MTGASFHNTPEDKRPPAMFRVTNIRITAVGYRAVELELESLGSFDPAEVGGLLDKFVHLVVVDPKRPTTPDQ